MIGAGAAVFFGHGDADEAELGSLAQRLSREAPSTVQFARQGFDFGLREFAHTLAQEFLLRRERKSHRVEPPAWDWSASRKRW